MIRMPVDLRIKPLDSGSCCLAQISQLFGIISDEATFPRFPRL